MIKVNVPEGTRVVRKCHQHAGSSRPHKMKTVEVELLGTSDQSSYWEAKLL